MRSDDYLDEVIKELQSGIKRVETNLRVGGSGDLVGDFVGDGMGLPVVGGGVGGGVGGATLIIRQIM